MERERDNPDIGKNAKRLLIRGPLGYGKRIYLGDFLAERLIQIIALVSIAIILAIFYYVFQEATYAFRSLEEQTSGAVRELGGVSRPSDDANGEDTPALESYDTETGGLHPDSYGLEGIDEMVPAERPGTENIAVWNETEGRENPVRIADLVAPNDTIAGSPRYIWQPIGSKPKFSLVPLFVGALKVTAVSILIAAPISVLAAIFTTVFARRWIREVLKPAIEILAGFPSVVIGFFCLITLASLIQSITGSPFRLNALVGGVGLSLAVIPIIYTVTEDALSAIPKYMKEASLALGASRWQTAWRVTLPAALPGVFAAILLGFGRAFGETMIVLMATGNAALVSFDIFEPVRTMSATIGAEMAEVEFQGVHYGILFLIGAVLFVVTFGLNAIAEFFVRDRLLKRFRGK